MSLKVNLIKESEQRSGSSLNSKSIMRIGSIVIPVALGFLAFQKVLGFIMLMSQLNTMEAKWQDLEPKQEMAKDQQQQLNLNKKTLAEIERWKEATTPWNQVVAAIMQCVPQEIQLTTLRVTLLEDEDEDSKQNKKNKLSRQYELILEGTTRVSASMQAVLSLQNSIRSHPSLSVLLASVSVANFAADETATDEKTRVFTIRSLLKPLPPEDKK